jgi:hypothetical protein
VVEVRADVRRIQELYLLGQQKQEQVVQVGEVLETAPPTYQIVQEVQRLELPVNRVVPAQTVQRVQVVVAVEADRQRSRLASEVMPRLPV